MFKRWQINFSIITVFHCLKKIRIVKFFKHYFKHLAM